MTQDELIDLLLHSEWYDNSRVGQIRGCERKAALSLIGPPQHYPITVKVGDGANFGTAFHAGLHGYYLGWGEKSDQDRRYDAILSFVAEWEKFFPSANQQNKHRLDRGLTILDSYFDFWSADDGLLEPVESEIGFIATIIGTTSMPLSSPFYYIGRVDRVFKRISDNTYWLHEFKTTSRDAEGRMKQLKFDNQTIGYTTILRDQNPDYKITGFISDVALVAAVKLDFFRQFYTVQQSAGADWRDELVTTIEDWRRKRRLAEERGKVFGLHKWLTTFTKDTNRCFDYGRCSFYDICDYGLSPEVLLDYEENIWNPLTQPTKKLIEVIA